MTTTLRAPGREIFGWAMFDFANSSYTTVFVTVVFSVIFPRLVGPITAVFFLVAAIPTSMFLRERGTPKVLPAGQTLVGMGVRR